MTIKFSEKEQTFYEVDWDYQELPDDLSDEISSELHLQLLDKMNDGYYIKSDFTISTEPSPNEFYKYNTSMNKWILPKESKDEYIEYLKKYKSILIDENYKILKSEPIEVNSIKYQANDNSLSIMKNLLDLEEDNYEYIDFDNNIQKLSYDELKEIWKTGYKRNSDLKIISRKMKDSLNDLKTVAALEKFSTEIQESDK